MKDLSLRILIIILLADCIYPQFSPGAKQIALSNSDIAVSDNVFSFFENPAGLAQINHDEAGVFFSPSPYGMSELKNAYAAFSHPMNFGAVAVGGMIYGFELYKETQISLGASYNYDDKFYVGGVFNYKNFSIKNYGSKNTIILDIGVLARLTDKLNFGFSYKNITHESLTTETDELPVSICSGLSYKIIDNCTASLAIEKDVRYKASPRFGIDYAIIKYLSIRTGLSKNPNLYSFGIGVNYSLLNFNYAVVTHQELGLTLQVGVVISFNKNEGDSNN
jgi:hypothetical protein